MTVSIEEHFGGAVRSAAIASDFRLVLGTGRVKHLNITRFQVRGYLPNATRLPLQEGGPVFILKNESACHPFCLFNFDGVEIGYVEKNSWARVFCLGTSTAAGAWGVTTCVVGGSSFDAIRSGSCGTSTTNAAEACQGGEDSTTTFDNATTTSEGGGGATFTNDGDWGSGTTNTDVDSGFAPLVQSCPGGASQFNAVNNIFGASSSKPTLGISTGNQTTSCHVFDSSLQFNPVAMPSQIARVAISAGRTDIASLANADAFLHSGNDRVRGLRSDGSSAFGTQPVPFALRGISLHLQNETIRSRSRRPPAVGVVPV